MAKKSKSKFEFSKIGNIMDSISKKVPIHIDNEIKEKKFISTGIYILDAAISARMLGGGIPNNRIFCVAGESGTGKSYLAYSITKNAQKEGYSVIFIDTEWSIDLEDLPKLGVDTSDDKFMLVRSNKVEDINITLTQLLDELKQEKLDGNEIQPIMIVLDSIGQMSSNKEKEDLLKGDLKADFTKAKAIGSLFRSVNTDLGFLNIPMVVCNHTYKTMDFIPQQKLKGGLALEYSASTIGMLTKAKLKTGDEDEMDLQSGIIATFKTVKSRLAKPKKIKIELDFTSGLNPYTGLDFFCRPEYFDKVGIAKGKMSVDKSTGEMKFKPGGNRWYVDHLDKTVTKKQFFTSEVFTEEVLKKLEPIVNGYFKYNSIEEMEQLEKEYMKAQSESDNYIDDIDVDGADLFE